MHDYLFTTEVVRFAFGPPDLTRVRMDVHRVQMRVFKQVLCHRPQLGGLLNGGGNLGHCHDTILSSGHGEPRETSDVPEVTVNPDAQKCAEIRHGSTHCGILKEQM